MIIKYISLILLYGSLFLNFNVFGQDYYRHYTIENGLLSNTVYSSISDRNGYMWFCTDQGVVCFNGSEFVAYTIDNGLTDNEVLRLYEDSSGRIWFITYNGLLCFFKNGKIHNPKNTPFLKKFDSKVFFTQVLEMNDGTIYFFKEGTDLYYVLDQEKITKKTFPNAKYFVNAFKKDNKIYSVCAEKKENDYYTYSVLSGKIFDKTEFKINSPDIITFFWPINKKLVYGASELQTGKMKFYSRNFDKQTESQLISTPEIFADKIYGCVARDGSYFFSTSNGAFEFTANIEFKRVHFETQFVTSITCDIEQGLWYTTKNNGVYYVKNNSAPLSIHVNQNINIIRENPFCKGKIYFAGLNELYILYEDKLNKFSFPNEFGKNEALTDMVFMGKDEVLLGNGYGYCLFNGETFRATKKHSGIKQLLIENDSIIIAKSTALIVQH